MIKLSEEFGGKSQKNEQDELYSILCESQNQNHQTPSADLKTVYRCPLKCEGDKTYHATGNCPDCKMRLVPTKPGISILGYRLNQVM